MQNSILELVLTSPTETQVSTIAEVYTSKEVRPARAARLWLLSSLLLNTLGRPSPLRRAPLTLRHRSALLGAPTGSTSVRYSMGLPSCKHVRGVVNDDTEVRFKASNLAAKGIPRPLWAQSFVSASRTFLDEDVCHEEQPVVRHFNGQCRTHKTLSYCHPVATPCQRELMVFSVTSLVNLRHYRHW